MDLHRPRRIIERLQHEGQHLRGASRRWRRDDGALMAAAVAYYVGLSFFPLLLVLISGFGMFLQFTQSGRNAEAELLTLVEVHLSEPLHDHLTNALSTVRRDSLVQGPLGLVGLIVASLAGFVQFERAFDRIWGIERTRRPGVLRAVRAVLVRRGTAFLLLLSAGLLIVMVFLASLLLSAIEAYANSIFETPPEVWRSARLGITLGLNTVMFTLLYHWLSKVPLRWRESLRGGLLAAVLWELGRMALTQLLLRTEYGSAYGVVGSFVAVLVWCYYAVAVVLFGAEYIQEVRQPRGAAATEAQRGVPQIPVSMANVSGSDARNSAETNG